MTEITTPAAAATVSTAAVPTAVPTARAGVLDGRRPSLLRAAILAGAGALALTGCGAIVESATENAIEQAIERDTGENVDIEFDFDDENAGFTIQTDEGTMVFDGDEDGGSYTIETEDGATSAFTFGTATEAPDCLPAELRLPDGFQGQMASSADGFCNFSAVAQGEHDIDALADRYAEALEQLGFPTEEISRSTFAANGSEHVGVSVLDEQMSVSVNVAYEPEYHDVNGNQGPATVLSIVIT